MSYSRAEQLQAELSRRESLENELQSRQPQQNNVEDKPFNFGISNEKILPPWLQPNMIKDVDAGIIKGAQNLGSGLLEAGEYLTRKGANQIGKDTGHQVDVPKWNAREFMGLEGENPINLGSYISKNPNKIAELIGQYGPSLLAGGPNALRQMLMQGAFGASQASPDQQNAFGLLPQGRGGAAIQDAALAGIPFGMKPAYNLARNVFSKLFGSSETVNKLLQATGQGKTITENIEELSKRMGYGQKTVKEEALIPKREIMAEKGEERIFPSQEKGKKISEQTASIFEDRPKDITPEQLGKYERAVKSYYNDGDIDTLVEKGEDIFNHPGLSEKDISKLDEALIPEKPVKGEYLKIKNPDDHYSDLIQEAHDAYAKNPTFRNSDKLRSRLFKRINELTKRQKAQTITDSQEVELRALKKNRNAIIKDQDNLISKFSPENQEKYGKFNKLWREDQRSYEDAGATIKNMKNGFLNNVTPQKITNAFSFPELKPQVQKILKDMGPEGVNNIIYNEIGKTKDPSEIIKILDKLEMNKGFAPYITPEIRNYSKVIRQQLRNQRIGKWSAGGAAATVGAGGLYQAGKNIFSH